MSPLRPNALRRDPGSRGDLVRRFAWLAACLLLGIAAGAIGLALTGSSSGFLAVPAVLAAGWLFVADPTQCLAARNPHHQARRGEIESPAAGAAATAGAAPSGTDRTSGGASRHEHR